MNESTAPEDLPEDDEDDARAEDEATAGAEEEEARTADEVLEDEEEEAFAGEPASFEELRDQGDRNGPGDLKLEMILDVPVTLTVEVGRTRLSLRELLKLNRGSVVELDQLVTQPMSLLVNDTLVAQGEPVMVNERFGIRLTDVVSAGERIRRLT
ncbi:MAG: flagellar motor switch protein FliN [Pseudomonadota bacterium]